MLPDVSVTLSLRPSRCLREDMVRDALEHRPAEICFFEASEHRFERSIGPVRDLLLDYGMVQVKPKDKRHAEGREKRCR